MAERNASNGKEQANQVDLSGVIEKELWEIAQRRAAREIHSCGSKAEDKEAGPEGRNVWQDCHARDLFGIGISGGGIRSATFALGVLQGLTKKKLLQQSDYISTVSGGGYIGSWLQGILRPIKSSNDSNADRPSARDLQQLYQPLIEQVPKPADRDPVTFLRKYSNYLAPRHGFSIDTLLIPMIWSRNMILNQLIIIAAFLAVFLLAFWPGVVFLEIIGKRGPDPSYFWIAAAVIAIISVLFMAKSLSRVAIRAFPDPEDKVRSSNSQDGQERESGARDAAANQRTKGAEIKDIWRRPIYKRGESTSSVLGLVVAPILIAVLLMMFALFEGGKQQGDSQRFTKGELTLQLVLLYCLFLCWQAFGGFWRCFRAQRRQAAGDEIWQQQKRKAGVQALVHILWMPAACAFFTWWLLWLVTKWVSGWQPDKPMGSQLAISFAPPLYILALMAGIVLHIGLMGRDFPDASREWVARAGTLFWIICAAWAGYFALVMFAPLGLANWYGAHGPSVGSAIGAWLLATASSVIAGRSARTSATGSIKSEGDKAGSEKPSVPLDLVARYGPFVAIGGFMLGVAILAQWLLHLSNSGSCVCNVKLIGMSQLALRYWEPYSAGPNSCWYWPLALTAGVAGIFFILSWRVNINEFSMHHFYKNRLVRCYLGASASSSGRRRHPDWFTGFDAKDDFPLARLRVPDNPKAQQSEVPRAPYPIVNATLNVTAGTDLATQERKGYSWIFTPWYSGFLSARSGEERKERGERDPGPAKTYADTSKLASGISLGTAVAISGAAANPDWGAHSSPQTAFLLTLFDVRLGWWVGNPGDDRAMRRPGPAVALRWLLRELFGSVDESSKYLNLSDGGHFENLGLYELVRRRCRYIIAIDGEQDQDYRFEGLGGAVRKCRDDFGVDIKINPRPIALKDGLNGSHCVVGRIYYPNIANEYPPEYRHKKVGNGKVEYKPGWILYIKSSVTGDEPADVEEYRREHPDFPQQSTMQQFFSESQFESYRALGEHACLTALDRYNENAELEENFERLSARWEMPPKAPAGASSGHAEAYSNLMTRLADHPDLQALDGQVIENFPSAANRQAVYFWLEVIQLAENIFLDFNFADREVWRHPSYAGWRRVFEYWASRPALREIWKSQKENYGKAFQYFFDDLMDQQQ